MKRWFVLVALLPMGAAVAAPAVQAELAQDVRCLVVTSELIGAEDASTRIIGMLASNYYFGRVDGRIADADLEKVISDEAKAIRPADRPALLASCGKQMQERGEALENIGIRLEAREEASAIR